MHSDTAYWHTKLDSSKAIQSVAVQELQELQELQALNERAKMHEAGKHFNYRLCGRLENVHGVARSGNKLDDAPRHQDWREMNGLPCRGPSIH